MLALSTPDQFVLETLVIALVMIVDHVFGQRVTEVPLTERNETVQALFLDRADKPFRVRVAVGRTKRGLHHAHTGAFQNCRTARLHFRSRSQRNARGPSRLSLGRQVPCDLQHECFVRMRRGSQDLRTPRTQFNREHRAERHQPARGPDLRRKEVGGDNRALVRSRKRLPGRGPRPAGRNALVVEDGRHRGSRDAMTKILQRALNARVPHVLFSAANNLASRPVSPDDDRVCP
jgi:hypothetical protein